MSETRNSAWVSTPRTEQQRGAYTLHAFIPIFNKHEAIILSKKKLGALMGANINAKSMNFKGVQTFCRLWEKFVW